GRFESFTAHLAGGRDRKPAFLHGSLAPKAPVTTSRAGPVPDRKSALPRWRTARRRCHHRRQETLCADSRLGDTARMNDDNVTMQLAAAPDTSTPGGGPRAGRQAVASGPGTRSRARPWQPASTFGNWRGWW